MSLKNIIPKYIAVKGDEVDETLADYINHQDGKSELRIMFTRRGSSKYYFGSKKIEIKL